MTPCTTRERWTVTSRAAKRLDRWLVCRSRSRTCSTRRAFARPPARSSSRIECRSRTPSVVEKLRDAGAVIARQAQHARVGAWRHERQPALRRLSQSVGARPDHRRVVRRFGGGAGGGHVLRRVRQRHRRLDPDSVVAVRRRRAQADVRTREPSWCRAAQLEPRSRRSDGAARGGRRAPARRHCGARLARIRDRRM